MSEEAIGTTRIESMQECDIDEVLLIEAASRQTSWSKQSFVGEMKNPFSFCFILKERNDPRDRTLGFICFRVLGKESELVNFGVHRLHRRKGRGRELMRFYIDFCRKRGVETFYLETGISNRAAIKLYQSLGYDFKGSRSGFYGGREDALLMVRKASCEKRP